MIVWQDMKYSCYNLRIPGGFTVEVFWKGDGFRVKFEGIELKETFHCLEDAKTAGVELARRKFQNGLKYLEA